MCNYSGSCRISEYHASFAGNYTYSCSPRFHWGPSWGHSLRFSPVNIHLINKAQRKILMWRIFGYSTILQTAANTLATTPSAEPLAGEREITFLARRQPTQLDTNQMELPRVRTSGSGSPIYVRPVPASGQQV